MSITNKIFGKQNVDNTGFSSNESNKSFRFINKDGRPNVIRKGTSRLKEFSVYHYMLNIPSWKFILIVFGFYTALNLFFAVIYYFFCLHSLKGIHLGSDFDNFQEAFFFSTQTLTTVGYGRISPVGLLANIVSSFEALVGIMSLAIITGLLYGRFVRPVAFIKFSKNILVSPFNKGKAFMFRLTTTKNTSLTDLNVQVTASVLVEDKGAMVYKYFPLKLQFETLNSLYLSWTIVHPIDEESPFYNLSEKELDDADLEIIIYLKAFDEHFSNTVVARTSYTFEELVFGAKFLPMFYDTEQGTVLEINKLNKFEKLG